MRKSHNGELKQKDAKMNGAAIMPTSNQLNITVQPSVLNAIPLMVQAKDDVNSFNFYRKPIMKEKS